MPSVSIINAHWAESDLWSVAALSFGEKKCDGAGAIVAAYMTLFLLKDFSG